MRSIDPTQTALIRRNFSLAVEGRYKYLDREVRNYFRDSYTLTTIRSVDVVEEHFRDWFSSQLHQRFSPDWYRRFLSLAYKKGLNRAYDMARPAYLLTMPEGMSEGFRLSFLNSAYSSVNLRRIYHMTEKYFENINHNLVTQAVGRVSRETVGDLNGDQLANEIIDDIQIAIRKGQAVARTETVRSHAHGTLDGLASLKVSKVSIQAEGRPAEFTANERVQYMTAGDAKVCPLCRPFDGVVMELKDAYSLIPIHTNCRCSFLPVDVPVNGPRYQDAIEEFSEIADF